jgi:outer membrane lipoprotein carrier protein
MSLPALAMAILLSQATPADRAIDAAVDAYAKVRTARATFEQTVTNPLVGRALHSRGEFEQSRPNRFVFRFSDPAGDVILSDGRHVWIYVPSTTPGQVIREPLSGDRAGSLDLIGEFFSNPRTRYVIGDGGEATVGDRMTRVVLLSPRSRDAAFVRARVWIDLSDGSLVQFEAEEPSGLTRRVRITGFTVNPPVAADAFTFRVPRGVRVVDGASIGR